MSYMSDFNDEVLKDKLETLLDEDNQIKNWNEGLLIKSLILLPIVKVASTQLDLISHCICNQKPSQKLVFRKYDLIWI